MNQKTKKLIAKTILAIAFGGIIIGTCYSVGESLFESLTMLESFLKGCLVVGGISAVVGVVTWSMYQLA